MAQLHEAHSSSGPGRRPLKAEITGSTPVCAIHAIPRLSQARIEAAWDILCDIPGSFQRYLL
jgi:hypothetical protein